MNNEDNKNEKKYDLLNSDQQKMKAKIINQGDMIETKNNAIEVELEDDNKKSLEKNDKYDLNHKNEKNNIRNTTDKTKKEDELKKNLKFTRYLISNVS